MIHARRFPARRREEGAHAGEGDATSRETLRRDQAFLSRQRYRLELARDTLVRELASGKGHEGRGPVRSRETDPPAPNASPRVLARELETMLDRKLKVRLLRTVRALEKIEEGTYGVCEVTGKPIARERLEQVPEDLETVEGRRRRRITAAR